jgi:hydrogenase expression/formation protein HypD
MPAGTFRDESLTRSLADAIREETHGAELKLMEVCGTHTMSIYRFGLRQLLPEGLDLLSGPGCPVCVTQTRYIDWAVAAARLPGTVVATFGDMVRVPGSTSSLEDEKAGGADIRIVYSPLDALALAETLRGSTVVFLGIGFETTAPTVAATILEAERRRVANFAVLTGHKLVPPALRHLASEGSGLGGLLCPGHVSVVIGWAAYLPLAQEHGIPCVVAGFEPVDILQGVLMLVRQINAGRAAVENAYSRTVSKEGNTRALRLMAQVFEETDSDWRGLGLIPLSGLALRERYRRFDAATRLAVDVEPTRETPGCLCGAILAGLARPWDCPHFGAACTPEAPLGPCMVSGEGTCAAHYRYGGHERSPQRRRGR